MASVTFTSAKSWFLTLVIWGATLLLLVLLVVELQSPLPWAAKAGMGIFCLGLIGFLLWTWFGTYYRISGETLQFRCGPIHGNIPIHEIRKIEQNKYLWSGLRPALGLQGLVIYYNRWDEIYISPKDRERFLQALQQVNPTIEVE